MAILTVFQSFLAIAKEAIWQGRIFLLFFFLYNRCMIFRCDQFCFSYMSLVTRKPAFNNLLIYCKIHKTALPAPSRI